jgi:hypothetical protein
MGAMGRSATAACSTPSIQDLGSVMIPGQKMLNALCKRLISGPQFWIHSVQPGYRRSKAKHDIAALLSKREIPVIWIF